MSKGLVYQIENKGKSLKVLTESMLEKVFKGLYNKDKFKTEEAIDLLALTKNEKRLYNLLKLKIITGYCYVIGQQLPKGMNLTTRAKGVLDYLDACIEAKIFYNWAEASISVSVGKHLISIKYLETIKLKDKKNEGK